MSIYHYGRIPDLEDDRDYPFIASIEHLKALPPSVDLRPEISFPPYDQGQLGSCVSNAVAAAMRFLKSTDMLSRLFIYYDGRRREGTINSDAGESVRDGIKTVVSIGSCQETEWPYNIEAFMAQPTAQCYADALPNKALQYLRLWQNLSQMQACLAAGLPFLIGFSVYESFESSEVATTGIVSMPQWGESLLGGHCVLCCGYNNATQRFLCLNSWGNWGMGGYFTIPYLYLLNPQLASDFWTIRLVS